MDSLVRHVFLNLTLKALFLELIIIAFLVLGIIFLKIFYQYKGRKEKRIRKITYRADFRVTYCDGIVEVVDVKGMRTPIYKLKLKMLLHRYPEINFVEV